MDRDGVSASRAAVTAALLAVIGLGARRLARARDRWSETRIAGAVVLEGEGVGPAVVGIVRPRIAVPAWIRRLDAELQALVARHEREHVRGGDPPATPSRSSPCSNPARSSKGGSSP